MSKLVKFTFIVGCMANNPQIWISRFESPATRFMTDGVQVIGVTDTVCAIKTRWKEASKKAAGITYSEVRAVDFIDSLDELGFGPYNPFIQNAAWDFVKVRIQYTYGNCKIVGYNISSYISTTEYTTSMNNVYTAAVNNNFFAIENNTVEQKTNSKLPIPMWGIALITIGCVLVCFCVFLFCQMFLCK